MFLIEAFRTGALTARLTEVCQVHVMFRTPLILLHTRPAGNHLLHGLIPDIVCFRDVFLALRAFFILQLGEAIVTEDHGTLWAHHDLTADQFIANATMSVL